MRSTTTFSISFFVKKHRASAGKVPVYLRITVYRKRLDISIKRKIDLAFWDDGKGQAKGSRSEAKALNLYLEQVRHHLYDCYQQLEKG